MYQQIKPTEVFREREMALRKEAEKRRLARRLYAGRDPKAVKTIAGSVAGFLATLVVAGLMLVASSSPAHAASTTTFTVNSASDLADLNPGDGRCDADAAFGKLCTLRAAIEEANFNGNFSQVDRINFKIPGTGVHTISVSTALPVISEPVVVNGYSQRGSSVNTLARGTNAKLRVEITPADNFLASSSVDKGGLTVGAQNSAVKGLVINRFPSTIPGIEVSPIVSRHIVNNVRIEGNFLGTDPSGTVAEGNGCAGLRLIAASGSTVGGTSLASRNLISGNQCEGVFIRGGTSLGAQAASNNLVRGNLIGTQKDGIKPLGNSGIGVSIFDSAAALPGGAHDANGNTILSNSIFSNGSIGIDLVGGQDDVGPNANDSGDTDAGPNRLQNKPRLSSAKTVSGKTTVKGTLNSRPGESYTIQFFSNPKGNEGRTFIGQKRVSTNSDGKASFTFSPAQKVGVGQTVTATATRNKTGDTSEFSAPRKVLSS